MSDQTLETEEVKVRRIFISYSWTSNDYVERVRELAEELGNHGMDVELDQWSLKEGDDKFHYMELMVNDPTIDKVLILLDKKYKEKADGREGGVGTEATIMTPKVYADVVEKRGKQKFIPVIMERDPDTGKEFVPAFLDGRKYTDLSDSEHYAEKFEELVRAIHNKPLHRKPLAGKIPNYLLADETARTGTGGRGRRASEFLANNNPQALNAVKDYFSLVIENLNVFDFPTDVTLINFELVLGKIQELAPIRDEVVDCFVAIARYRDDPAFYEEIRNFFEQLLVYFEFRNAGDSNNTWAADHYKFLGHELFLYAVAASLKFQRFSQLNELTEQGYFCAGSLFPSAGNTLLPFMKFNTYSEALSNYNRSLRRQYLSYDPYLINQRATRQDITFESLMQADFFLYTLFEIDEASETPSGFFNWYPSTLTFAEHRYSAFEIFSRSQSRRFFERFRVSLRNSTKEFLIDLFNRISASKEHSYNSFRRKLPTLTRVDLIATRP
jgi:hypothetical protein